MTWTDEDQSASRGEFDPRPAYIVKLPNQQISATIDQRFSAVSTRALLDALIHDHLQTPAGLQTWVSHQKITSDVAGK
jgi:hypothetical protein